MFIKKFLLNVLIATAVIAIACFLNEKIGFSIYGFDFKSADFTNPVTYAAIVVLAIVLTLFGNFKIGYLKQAGILFVLVLLSMLAFDFYFNSDKDEQTGKYKNERKEQIDTRNIVSDEELHIGIKTIFLVSNGGYINASCNEGYRIVIESQDNQSSESWNRLIYDFQTKTDYLDALHYINKKGYRWIINHQFENEYSWNADHKINFEDYGNNMRTVNIMKLNKIKK